MLRASTFFFSILPSSLRHPREIFLLFIRSTDVFDPRSNERHTERRDVASFVRLHAREEEEEAALYTCFFIRGVSRCYGLFAGELPVKFAGEVKFPVLNNARRY